MSRVHTINNGASTSTGIFPSTATYPNGLDLYQVCGTIAVDIVHNSTKQVAFVTQGSLAGSGVWTALHVASSSTGSSQVLSTASGLWNRVRFNVTANGSTGNVTTTWTVGGKP